MTWAKPHDLERRRSPGATPARNRGGRSLREGGLLAVPLRGIPAAAPAGRFQDRESDLPRPSWLTGTLLLPDMLPSPACSDRSGPRLRAAQHAGRLSGVLVPALPTATGRAPEARPWPVTVRARDRGYRLGNFGKAPAFARVRHAGINGASLVRFHLTWQWQGGTPATLDRLLDPLPQAAGVHHPRTTGHASQNRRRFNALRAKANTSTADAGRPRRARALSGTRLAESDTATPLPSVHRSILLRAGSDTPRLGVLPSIGDGRCPR